MVGSISQFIENMERRNVDELILLDINATLENRKPLFEDIKRLTKNLFCPLTYGGGISSLDDIKILINECGIDKISIKSNFSLIYSAARIFGAQAIIYSADFKGGNQIDGIPKKLKWERWLKLIEQEGAGEILLTDTVANGQQMGYNNRLIKQAAKSVNIPIIANGGCGNPIHMVGAIKNGASAVAASSMFLFQNVTPHGCAKVLSSYNIPSRLDAVRRPTEALGRPIPEPAL